MLRTVRLTVVMLTLVGLGALAFAGLASAQVPIPYYTRPLDPGTTNANFNDLIHQIDTYLLPLNQGPTSPVNLIYLTNAATGNTPTISPGGASSDTNVALGLSGKGSGNIVFFPAGSGTGILQFGSSGSLVPANGIGTCAGASAKGPLGVSPNVQGFIPVLDWLSRARFIPVC